MANTERAWVLVDKFEEPPLSDGVERPEMLRILRGRPMRLFTIKIYGNTPARMSVYMSGFIWLTERTTLRNQICPMSQVYQDSSAILRDLDSAFVKAADQEVHLPVLFEGGYYIFSQLTEIGKRDVFPCIYGRGEYWDASFSFDRAASQDLPILLYFTTHFSHGGRILPMKRSWAKPDLLFA